MLRYLIVIISPKKLENRLHTDKKLTDMKSSRWTQKQRKNLKKTTLSFVNAGPPDTEYLYYPLNMEGITQKGPLLPAHIRY